LDKAEKSSSDMIMDKNMKFYFTWRNH